MSKLPQPELEIRAEQPCVYIPLRMYMGEWDKAISLSEEVCAWLAERGLPLTSAPFFRYCMIGDMYAPFNRPFELEIGVPVEDPLSGDGRVLAGVIPAGVYAVLLHQGHPDQLLHSCARLEQWALGQGLRWKNERIGENELWGGRYEFYMTDPAEEPDLNNWVTEIAYLVQS